MGYPHGTALVTGPKIAVFKCRDVKLCFDSVKAVISKLTSRLFFPHHVTGVPGVMAHVTGVPGL